MNALLYAAADDESVFDFVTVVRTSPGRHGNIRSLVICRKFTFGFGLATGRVYRLAARCLAAVAVCSMFRFLHGPQSSFTYFRLSLTFHDCLPRIKFTSFPPCRLLTIIHNCDVICHVTSSSVSFTYRKRWSFICLPREDYKDRTFA